MFKKKNTSDAANKQQLVDELAELRARVAELESPETRHAQIEKSLHEARERLNTTLDALSSLLFEVDRDGRVYDFFTPRPELLYIPPHEFLGKILDQFFPREPASIIMEAIAEAAETGQPKKAIYSMEIPTGIEWFELSIVAKDDPTTPDDRFIALVHNVTAQKQAEKETQQQTAQLEALRQVGLKVTAQLDLDARLHTISSHAAELLGGTMAGIQLYRPKWDALEAVVGAGMSNPPLGRISQRGEGLAGKIWETGAPMVTSNYGQWKDRDTTYQELEIAGAVGVPIRWGPADTEQDFLGTLIVVSDTPDAFSQADAELLGMLATQAAVAIRNASLYKAGRKQVAQLTVVNQVARQAASILDPKQLVQEIVAAIQKGFGYYNVALFLFDESTGMLNMLAMAGGFKDVATPDYQQKVGVGMIGWTVETGQPLLANDVSHEPRYIPGFLGKVTLAKSELCAPLKLADRVIGALDVQDTRLNAFDETDLMAMETLADQVAVALENARLYAEARHRAERLAVINHISRAISDTLHLDDLIEAIHREIISIFQADAFCIAFYDEQTNELDYRLQIEEGVREPSVQRPLGKGLTAHVITQKSPLLIRNLEQEHDRLPPLQVWGSQKLPASWLGVPMQIEDQVIGVTCVQAYRPHAFDEDDQLLLSTIAEQVAMAMESARLFQSEREQRELAEALAEAAAAVNTLNLDQVLDHILEQIERIVDGDAFNVMLLTGSTTQIVRWRGYEPLGLEDSIAYQRVPLTKYPSIMKMATTGEPIVIPDTADESNWIPGTGQKQWRSYIGAPIQVDGETVGFINVNGARPGQFGPADARRLLIFANHTATAVANARLHQQVLDSTEQLKEQMQERLDYAAQLEQQVQKRTGQLAAQYARLETILHSTADGIIGTDATGKIVQLNPVARDWLTRSLSHEDSLRLRKAVRELAQQAEERTTAVLELTGLDLELKIAPISKPDVQETLPLVQGEPSAVVTIHDVSQLKDLDRIKTNFVKNASHELRTPITTIQLYAHLLQRTPPEDEKWQQRLTALVQEADTQVELGESILQLSRIYGGRMELELHQTTLASLAQDAVSKYQARAQKRGLTLKHELLSSPVTGAWDEKKTQQMVSVDAEQMTHAINNLVEDAIRYTPEGGRVIITTGKKARSRYLWDTFSVSDTGEEIPEQDMPQVFSRLFREGDKEPQSKRVRETGLRLMVVKEVAGLHDGLATVESKSTGNTFTMWLPLTG